VAILWTIHSTASQFRSSDIQSETCAKSSIKGTEAKANPFESERESDLLGQKILPVNLSFSKYLYM
jgi:hypothetical protein